MVFIVVELTPLVAWAIRFVRGATPPPVWIAAIIEFSGPRFREPTDRTQGGWTLVSWSGQGDVSECEINR